MNHMTLRTAPSPSQVLPTGSPHPTLTRRGFLKRAAQTAAALALPQIVPGSVLGRDGGVAPSDRIVMGGIGIGNRGSYDLDCFLPQKDVQFIAVCDVKKARREAVKKRADAR